MKALVISVGTGTKSTKNVAKSLAGALTLSINHHKPDKIFFLATKESEEATLPLILKKIESYGYDYEVVKIENPDNVQQIYEVFQPRILQMKENYEQLVVDYTSGTKAMAAAITMLATVYEADELSYITGKREGGIVQRGTEQVISIRPYFASVEQKIKMVIQFFNTAQYEASRSILEQIQRTIRDPAIIDRISPQLNLSKAYALWDKFQHQQAFKILRKIKMPELDRNKKFLGQLVDRLLKNREPEPYLIADLINNAERRGNEQQKYDDAVARLYRTIELIAQYKLKTQYAIDPSKAETSKIPKELLKKWNIPEGTETIKLSLKKDYELLSVKGDELGQKYEKDKTLKKSSIKKKHFHTGPRDGTGKQTNIQATLHENVRICGKRRRKPKTTP